MDLTRASKNIVAPATAPVKKVAKSNTPGSMPTDGTGIVEMDPWLGPFKDDLRRRFSKANEWIQKLNSHEGGLKEFSKVSQLARATPPILSSRADIRFACSRDMKSLASMLLAMGPSLIASGLQML